jgi:putative FmdB family regulatory protein
MPIYEYRCLECGEVFSHLLQASQVDQQSCTHCGSEQTKRLYSSFAVGGKVKPGPGRAAWPTSWNDTNGGDPETLSYWRHRIEHEARLEEKYPELRDPSLLKGSGEVAPEAGQQHSHAGDQHAHHHHPHPHPHPHGTGGQEQTSS